jgi:hypothetical protein
LTILSFKDYCAAASQPLRLPLFIYFYKSKSKGRAKGASIANTTMPAPQAMQTSLYYATQGNFFVLLYVCL